MYYHVAEKQINYDYYVPENLLLFAKGMVSLHEKSLLSYVGNLKVTQREYESRLDDKKKKCLAPIGKRLNSFSFMNESEKFSYQYENGEIEGHKGNKIRAKQLLDENNSMTEAQKIVSRIKWYGNIGHVRASDIIQYVFDELEEVGVALTENQTDKFINKVIDFHNNSCLMCIKGWRPVDLMQRTARPSAISFGPGIKQSIEEGLIDKDELVKMIHSMGIDFIDE